MRAQTGGTIRITFCKENYKIRGERFKWKKRSFHPDLNIFGTSERRDFFFHSRTVHLDVISFIIN